MSEDKLQNLRHSAAHLLAKAVLELYPGSHNAIGPAIESGFYQDFDMGEYVISVEDLPVIKKKMLKTLNKWDSFSIREVSAEQAKKDFAHNPYKAELVEEFAQDGKTITETLQGDFLDLCKGGHTDNPKELKYFALLSVAGAYWRGDENNKMLTRIYGTAFETKEELEAYLKQIEEAKKRDHRKIGKELDLFTFSKLVGSGLPLFTPRGTLIRHLISEYLNELKESKGYGQVDIPHLAKTELYKTSGHWDKFKDDIFHVQGMDEEFVLKPMNCPHHTQIYASQPRSYKDLPIGYAEITKQYRDEQSGELHGLSRVRSISIDDTHVFLRPDQILEECKKAYDIIHDFYAVFGMQLEIRLSVRDMKNQDNYLGTDEMWKNAEGKLKELLAQENRDYFIGEGEAAFYGPKIDFMVKDSIGRTWQLSTIQLDFNQPERFKLEYTDDNGDKVRPVMIHIAIAGSLERFLSIIIEHFAGNFPVWLSPVQVRFIAVGEKHVSYCEILAKHFKDAGIRVEVDADDETVGNKIRKGTKLKIPYLLVIGDKEIEVNILAVRKRGTRDTMAISSEDFVALIKEKVSARTLEL